MNFAIANSKTEQVKFDIFIDEDGDLIISATNEDIDSNLFYISSDTGNIHRFYGVAKSLGFELDEDERLIVGD